MPENQIVETLIEERGSHEGDESPTAGAPPATTAAAGVAPT